jgi:arylsulfatase A-like enzyme
MLDDLGKEWVSCYGSQAGLTPNADSLAAQGMKFDNVYSLPVCVPTRTTFLTGQYPARHGWKINWNAPFYGIGYFDPAFYPSIARILRGAGYATAAAGKWQLNDFRVHPDVLDKLGFDAYCMWTGLERGNLRSSRERYWNPYVHTKKGSAIRKGKFGEDVFVDFFIRFMARHKDQPIMLYYPMCLPHSPLVSTPLDPDVRAENDRRTAMINYADFKLGQIIEALDSLGIRDKTMIVWTSDNGSPAEATTALDGRSVSGGKGTLRERGINVPFIVSCPNMVPAGVTSDALIDFTDLLPTFAELAEGQPGDAVLDGQSFAGHLLGLDSDGPRRWIMSMGASEARLSPESRLVPATPYSERVVRDKRYKLWIGEDRRSWKLIDLATDPDESNDLLDSREPEHRRARAQLERVVQGFSEDDAAPRYQPLPAQPWDLPAEEAIRRFNQPD